MKKYLLIVLTLATQSAFSQIQFNQVGFLGKVGVNTFNPDKQFEVNGQTKLDGNTEVTSELKIQGELKLPSLANPSLSAPKLLSLSPGGLVNTIIEPCSNSTSSARLMDPSEKGENSKDVDSVIIYPNPTRGLLTLEMRGFSETETHWVYELYDLNGRLIRRGVTQGGQTEIDLSRENNGMYHLNIIGAERVSSWKIVKSE